MNRLLLLGLIGGGAYWLYREAVRQNTQHDYLEDDSGSDYESIAGEAYIDHEQEMLDEALADSFPASDPPSISPPRSP